MNTLLHWLTSPEWALIVKALLHSLWQGALITIALALVLRRVASPAARYRLALGGLGAVLLSAMLTWGVLNAPKAPPVAITPAPATTITLPAAPTGPVQQIVVAANWTVAQPQMQWTAWLALVWLIGASVMLGRASVKVAGAEQLRRSCQPLTDSRIADLVTEARRAVKLTRQVRVVVTQQLTSPAVVGVLMPTLILPLSLMTTLSPGQIRFVLLHEFAHIRRGDYLANLFQLFAEALLFFNPAVWWLSHQIRREREACCDALAIELSGAPADYARTLVSVAETMLQPAPAAAPAFGNDHEPSSLSDRVHRVLVPGYRPSLRLTWRAMLAALVAAGVLLGLLAAGTRETVAAAASLLAANQQEAEQVSQQMAVKAEGTNLVIRTFRITALELARAVGDVGPLPTTNTAANLQQFAALAGFDPQLPGRALFFSTAGGLFVRGTVDEIARVEKAVTGKPANSQSLQSSNPDDTNLVTRTFKVDPNTFVMGLKSAGGWNATNLTKGVRDFFASVGVDLQPPKAMFFNERQGGLFVRASLADLDIIEQALQVLNAAPPQVNIRAEFVEVPANNQVGKLLEGLLPSATNVLTGGNDRQNLTNGFAGILTASQAKAVFKALKQTKGVEILTAPEVTTVSGRQAQIQMVDIQTVVTGVSSVGTGKSATNAYRTSALPFGPVLDVIPHVAADGHTVHLTLIPSVTEFLGYERPDDLLTEFARSNSLSASLPLPRFRVRQLTTSSAVWDGQTIVLGGFISEIVTRQQDGSETRKPEAQEEKKHLLIFVTPTIVDPSGKRVAIPADGIHNRDEP